MKKVKHILMIFCVVMVMLFLMGFIIYKVTGNNIILIIFASKSYVQFDNLEKVVITYNSENSYFEKSHTIKAYPELQDLTNYEIEVTDKKLLGLIEENYQNKLVIDRNVGHMNSKGNFSIIINDDLEVYPKIYEKCTMRYKDNFLDVKFDQELYDEMVKAIISDMN